jgi:type I restriction enzyme R subunit
MRNKFLAESDIETAAIEWLLELKPYRYLHGEDISRNRKKAYLENIFSKFLHETYKHVPEKILAEVQQEFLFNTGTDIHQRNHAFHFKLSKGISKTWTTSPQPGDGVKAVNSPLTGGQGGVQHFEHFYPINYNDPSKNDFLIVNQFTIEGKNTRRPDLIIFINGLPIVLFEFKNLFDADATVENAFNQVQHYIEDIPQTFETNALTVISDGLTTLHGMFSSGMEWFAAWKSIDGIKAVTDDFALETLIKGLLVPERLLEYLRFYIYHELDGGKIIKKGAKYHQFFGVKYALAETLKAIKPIGDGRIGVIWHTTRSGKSITMAIYAGILRQMAALKNPTIVVQVDRFDLNKQLYEDFIAAKDLVGDIKLADNTDDLRSLLSGEGGGVIFSTIEKFRLKTSATTGGIKGGVKDLLAEGKSGINTAAFTKFGVLQYNPNVKVIAHDLRYAGNLPEVLLWNQLKRDALGVDFHRQKAIGNFVVDLFCPELMLAIEIDGKIHNEPDVAEYDVQRQQKLEDCGIVFLRYTAKDVFQNIVGVCEHINMYVADNKIGERLNQIERAVYNKNKQLLTDTPLTPLEGGITEAKHPILSTRENIIVIADECHRTQYGLLQGFANNLRKALPNASFIGFTGTPVDTKDADSVAVFGEIVHTYDIRQATEDKAVVPIYYEPRLAKLHLNNTHIEEEAEEIAAGLNSSEKNKILWAAAEDAAGADARVAEVSKDILEHFIKREASLDGKAMIVCMSRRNCVKMYDALIALKGCPEAAVIMTSNIGKDPITWNPHVRTKESMEAVKARFKDPNDPLKIVIVRDMWLTGFDNPPLHTLYIDKIMSGHNLIQSINRVATVFKDKPSGLIVDYIGIGENLRDATKKYTSSGGKGDVTIPIEEGFELAKEIIDVLQNLLPKDFDYSKWFSLSRGEQLKLVCTATNHIVADEDRCKDFMLNELKLSGLASIVKSHADIDQIATDIIFLQHAGAAVRKVKYPKANIKKKEGQIKELIHRSIDSDEVVDVFKMAGIEKFDISIIDDEFLITAKEKPSGNELKLELIRQIMNDEIKLRQFKNIIKYKKLKEEVDRIIREYHNHFIDSLIALQKLRDTAKSMQDEDTRRRQLGLTEEEEAFYEILASHKDAISDFSVIKEIVIEVTAAIKKNLQIDWYKKPDAKAQIMLAVKRILSKKGVSEELQEILNEIMEQAEARYKWWMAA